MLVIAHHQISDPESFWALSEKVIESIPGNMKLHGVYPAMDGKTGTCLWEAERVNDVQQFLDTNVGPYARNFCYEVNTEKSMGLSKIQMEEGNLS